MEQCRTIVQYMDQCRQCKVRKKAGKWAAVLVWAEGLRTGSYSFIRSNAERIHQGGGTMCDEHLENLLTAI